MMPVAICGPITQQGSNISIHLLPHYSYFRVVTKVVINGSGCI